MGSSLNSWFKESSSVLFFATTIPILGPLWPNTKPTLNVSTVAGPVGLTAKDTLGSSSIC